MDGNGWEWGWIKGAPSPSYHLFKARKTNVRQEQGKMDLGHLAILNKDFEINELEMNDKENRQC